MAEFYGGVEMLHVPLERPDQQPAFDVTVNRPPAGAVYLKAAQMKVYSAKDAAGVTRQQMEAQGKASVTYGDEFYGNGDSIKFDESKQLMKIESFGGGLATVTKLKARGNEPSKLRGRTIIYNRLADSFEVDGAYSITGN
jgi:lipopolysaccharide export system protein LptA